MTWPDDPHSIRNEPQYQRQPARPDQTESGAAKRLERETGQDAQRDHLRVGQSVHDEPDIFPGREPTEVDRDWTCSNCGYNLRGLKFGTRCPECGAIEIYRPSPTGVGGFNDWLARRQAATSGSECWRWAWLTAFLGAPWAILAAVLGTAPAGFWGGTPVIYLVVFFGLTIEEVMKIGLASLWVETRPYVFKNPDQIWLATLGAAFGFSAIENVLYVHMPWSNAPDYIILWRWTITLGMHVGCTALATRGLIAVWERCVNERRPADLTKAFPAIVTSISVHASYNAFVVLLNL